MGWDGAVSACTGAAAVKGATHIVAAEVRLQLACEDLERGALANTVRPDEPEHLARARRRQTVELERVSGVPMGDFGVEVRGQVDDSDGFEWAPGVWVSRKC